MPNQAILKVPTTILKEEQAFIDLIHQSMKNSARQLQSSLGRPSSHATREEALKQVEMLNAAKKVQETLQ